MSDETLAKLHKAGPIKATDASGSFELEFGKDGSLTQSLEFEVNENGINGKVRMKSKMDACPDADGRVTVESEVDSQMSVKGKPGTGGRVQTTFKYERYLDDDAHLRNTADGVARSLHIRMGGYENFESQSVELTFGHKRDGNIIFEHHDEQGFSIFRPDEVKRSAEIGERTRNFCRQ